jgi:TIR domain-containing protein
LAQVFLSYASQDRRTAMALADALKGRGWTVFWDRTIPPGKMFDQVIGEALRAAACVVVLWSRASVESRWVKEEAEDAAERNILIPALIDDVPLPLGFRRLHAARLVGWPGSHDANEFDQLTESIAVLLANESSSSHARPAGTPAASQTRASARSPIRLSRVHERALRGDARRALRHSFRSSSSQWGWPPGAKFTTAMSDSSPEYLR